MTPPESRHSTDSTKPHDHSPGVQGNLVNRTRGTETNRGNEGGEAPSAGVDAIVPIETHCDGCDHVSEPPDFRCAHQDGRIVEVVDRDRVRVRGCPVVDNGDESV